MSSQGSPVEFPSFDLHTVFIVLRLYSDQHCLQQHNLSLDG